MRNGEKQREITRNNEKQRETERNNKKRQETMRNGEKQQETMRHHRVEIRGDVTNGIGNVGRTDEQKTREDSATQLFICNICAIYCLM